MKEDRIDTDGIFDKCECGANVKFIYDTMHQPLSCRADCTECANTTDWVFSESVAMVKWNKMMRFNKSGGIFD